MVFGLTPAKTHALSTNFCISNRCYIFTLAKTMQNDRIPSEWVPSLQCSYNKKYSLKSSQKFSKMKCLAKAHIQNTETKWFPFLSGSVFCDLQLIPCGSLHHLILVVGDIARQTTCQEYPNELEKCNSKRNSSNDSKIGL